MAALAAFCITTARSATQWLATALRTAYPDRLDVAHEPLGFRYAPCRTLRNPAALAALAREAEVRAHFERIHAALGAGRSYAEVGFPCVSLPPLLQAEFGSRLRLIHLTRNPVQVAASLVTHRWYENEEGRAGMRGLVALTPFDFGTRLKAYARPWPTMTPFERGLYYWAEVHRYGLELEAALPAEQFARFRAEDLVAADPEPRRQLAAFLELPERTAWLAPSMQTVDRFRMTTNQPIDVDAFALHPEIQALADRLGYPATAIDARRFAARYRTGPAASVNRRMRRTLRRLTTLVGD